LAGNVKEVVLKVSSGIFKFFAVILAIVVVFSLPAALLGKSAGRLLFSPNRVFELLDEYLFNTEVMASLAEYSIHEGNTQEEAASPYIRLAIEGLKRLSHEQWVVVLDLIAPPELISDTIKQIVRGYYNWIASPDTVPEIWVDMRPWKDTLGKYFTPVADRVMSMLPACNTIELFQYAEAALNPETEIPLCKPPEPFYSDYLITAYLFLPNELLQIGDEVNFAANSELTEAEWANRKDSILAIRAGTQFAWVVVLILYVMIIPLGARSFTGVLKWAAWPILFAGGLLLLIALAFFAPGQLAGNVTGMANEGVPPMLIEPMRDLISGIFQYLARPLLLQAFAMIFLSVLGIGAAIFIDVRQMNAEEQSTVVRPGAQAEANTLILPEEEVDQGQRAGENDESKKDDSKPSGMFG